MSAPSDGATEMVLGEGVGPVPVRLTRGEGGVRAVLTSPRLPARHRQRAAAGGDGAAARPAGRGAGRAPPCRPPAIRPACPSSSSRCGIANPSRASGSMVLPGPRISGGARRRMSWRSRSPIPRAAASSTCACSRRPWALRRIRRPAPLPSPSRACWRSGSGRRSAQQRWLIRQGCDMGRPSLIELEVDIAGGALAAVRVGGSRRAHRPRFARPAVSGGAPFLHWQALPFALRRTSLARSCHSWGGADA